MVKEKTHRISVIDDERAILEVIRCHLEETGYKVAVYTDPNEALRELDTWQPHLVITDLRMTISNGLDVLKSVKAHNPETNVIMMTAFASVDSAVQAIRSGAIDYVIKPFKLDALDEAIHRGLNETRIVPGLEKVRDGFPKRYQMKNLIGSGEEMEKIYERIRKSARTASTVLITGESGTGKELVARAIHYNSPQKRQSFVGINCAALPETLLESELFGHEKGSFTGAVATKLGLFELAHKGTLFLDEVGEISLSIQVKLLRTLQEKVIKRVGGVKDIPVDLRIIAATNRNLVEAVEHSAFRKELYYRLNVIPISLPPLRERKEDIPKLAEHFVQTYCEKLHIDRSIDISTDALGALRSYDWPGNVRELENVIERILALSENGSIDRTDVEEALSGQNHPIDPTPESSHTSDRSLKQTMDTFERKLISEALAHNGGNKVKTAKQLGLTRQSLQYKIKKYNL